MVKILEKGEGRRETGDWKPKNGDGKPEIFHLTLFIVIS